jgi:predicted DNA-binding transcriptional regulator AlpA
MRTDTPKQSFEGDRKPGMGRPKVVCAREAARLVGLSESTLAKLRLTGNGPIYCKLGRRVVYRPADLEEWLQSRTTRDTSDADARFLKALTAAHPRR